MELKLRILAKDIRETNYNHSKDCAITRALERAGRPDLKDEGVDIVYKETREVFTDKENPSYLELSNKVVDLYKLKRFGRIKEIKGFNHTLVI